MFQNTITSVLERAKKRDILGGYHLMSQMESFKVTSFLNNRKLRTTSMPDYEYVHKELAKKGVTLTLFRINNAKCVI